MTVGLTATVVGWYERWRQHNVGIQRRVYWQWAWSQRCRSLILTPPTTLFICLLTTLVNYLVTKYYEIANNWPLNFNECLHGKFRVRELYHGLRVEPSSRLSSCLTLITSHRVQCEICHLNHFLTEDMRLWLKRHATTPSTCYIRRPLRMRMVSCISVDWSISCQAILIGLYLHSCDVAKTTCC